MRECLLSTDRDLWLITPLMLNRVLLNKDRFMAAQREVEDEIIFWEQAIVDQSNEDIFRGDREKSRKINLLKFVLETAWEHNAQISPDEKNLINKLQLRLKITDREVCIIEAKLGKFPKPGNQIHMRGEIDAVRQTLQSKGLVFSIRDIEGTDFDIIPDEVAASLRRVFSVEIRHHGYREMLAHKHVRSKAYLTEVLEKSGIVLEGSYTLDELQATIVDHISPSVLLGGLSPKDGLSMETLANWCAELDLPVSGPKAERITRLIRFYDNLLQRSEIVSDQRETWYQHYREFASRNLEFLRSQMLIAKDNEVERKFEEATDYLFENRLGHKPLTQVGSEHPDGALSFRDELIYWDNKSKEGALHLKEHIRQFGQYIKNAEKRVACFLVIAPDFTDESSVLAMQYRVENGATISLITADELKGLAEEWVSRDTKKTDNPFPLGYLIQPGRFSRALVAAL